MKNGKKLLLLLLILAVLVGATAIAGAIGKNAAGQEDETRTVFSLNPETVTNLGWDYSEKVSFTAGEDGWVCDQDAAFPLDETYLDKMLEALTDVESTKTIENPENLDQYGLEIPVCVITVEDGQSHTLSIGLETAVGGQRYFSNGDGNVYLVDSDIIEHFQYGLYDVLKHQTLPEVTQLTGLTVALPGGGYEITREENSGLAYSDDYVWFMDGKALDNDLTQTLLDMVTNLNLSECVDYNATDLSRYGLDAPAVTATVLDGGKAAYTLEISASENGECYVRLSDSKMIYQRDATLSDTLRYTTYADLQPDAAGKPLGRTAVAAANLLRGKHKVDFTPNVDCGDNVIIINTDKAVLTGKKAEQKKYYRVSGWIGGLKETKARDMMAARSDYAVELAVKGMLPKNTLGKNALTRLHLYKGAEHPHAAQKPKVWNLD